MGLTVEATCPEQSPSTQMNSMGIIRIVSGVSVGQLVAVVCTRRLGIQREGW